MMDDPLTQEEIAAEMKAKVPDSQTTVTSWDSDLDTGMGEDANLAPLDIPWLRVDGVNVTGVWKHPDYGKYQMRVHVATAPQGLAVTDNIGPLKARIDIVAQAVEQALRDAEARWRAHEQTESQIGPQKLNVRRKEEPKEEDKAEEL